MADPITWGLLNLIKKRVKGVQTTLDGVKNSVDTLPEDVQTKLDAFEVTIDELKKNVEDTLADVQETVENSPAGIPAPPLLSMSAQSTENGIKVTYKPSIFFGRSSNSFVVAEMDSYDQLFSLTKGVMIRYSNESFPLTPKDGILAVIDEDIFTVDNAGEKTAKQKTYEIVGLSNGETYYISAFPYSTNNLYNLSSGGNTKNRTKCQWTGTKGTLTVNVTQDYDYKPLGEYTATMTPTAGGQPITKTQSGAATIVFSGLEAGEYTLSFSEVSLFFTPENQSVTITAGQSQIVSAEYEFKANLNDLTWIEINEIGQLGITNAIAYGSTKDFVVNGETLTAQLIGKNTDDLTTSGKAKMTFDLKYVMNNQKRIHSSQNNSGGFVDKEIYTWLNNDLYNALPSDLKSVIKTVNKKTSAGNELSTINTNSMKIFLLAEIEVLGTSNKSKSGEGSLYPYYTTADRRKKTKKDGTVSEYWTRSPYAYSKEGYAYISDTGTQGDIYENFYDADKYKGISFAFCI